MTESTGKRLTAAEKRLQAIGQLVRRYLDGNALVTNEDGYLFTRIVNDINALGSMGRTARWQAAISGWVDMINEAASGEVSGLWALQQGAIYAGYAAL